MPVCAIIFPGLKLAFASSPGIENSEDNVDTLIIVLKNIARQQKTTRTDIRKQVNEFIADKTRRVYSQT